MATLEEHVQTQPGYTVHNDSNSPSSSIGIFLAMLALILIAFLVITVGLPILRNMATGPQITVPDRVDVNLNQPQ